MPTSVDLTKNHYPGLATYASLADLRTEAARAATRAGIDFLTDDETLARTFEPIACMECEAEGFTPEQCDAFRITNTHPPRLRVVAPFATRAEGRAMSAELAERRAAATTAAEVVELAKERRRIERWLSAANHQERP